ncbi:MAG: rRNA maturation RNase YbeY [Patescibacteria group bacterium]
MNIELINKTKNKLPLSELKNLAEFFAKKYRLSFSSLAVVFVGEQRIKTLNHQYRGQDTPTDVLSFSPANFPDAAAELIICPLRVFRHQDYREVFLDYPELFSSRLNATLKKKLDHYLLCFVLVHGLLHLVGYNDEKEKDRLEMVAEGRKFLANKDFLIN